MISPKTERRILALLLRAERCDWERIAAKTGVSVRTVRRLQHLGHPRPRGVGSRLGNAAKTRLRQRRMP